jgi:hypothetical protein
VWTTWIIAAPIGSLLICVLLLGSQSYGGPDGALFSALSCWSNGGHQRCSGEETSRQLYLLMPINQAGAGKNLCKTILSSIVQGYKPIIINWESTSTDRAALQVEKVTGE